jgi:hypothetical protein
VLAALGASGCLAESTTTRVAFDDMRYVTLRAANGALGPSQSEALLAEGAMSPEPGALSRYSLGASRDANGSIAFEWKLGAPLLNGEHQTVVGAQAPLELTEPLPSEGDRYVTRATLTAPEFRLASCATLRGVSVKGTYVGFRAAEWESPCFGDSRLAASIPFTVETPWSNVRDLRQTVEPMTGFAITAMVVSTLVFGGLGATVFALDSPRNGWGWGLVSTGAIIDLAWIPTLISSRRDTLLHARSAGPPQSNAGVRF